jgi:precorrin-2 dehydrogenase / sirohydrochlorin ferrochelatase
MDSPIARSQIAGSTMTRSPGHPIANRQESHSVSPLFPIFLKLTRRRCLVVGAGTIAEGKIAGLLDAGARVRVVAPQATAAIAAWARNRRILWSQRVFEPADLDRAFLVIAATSSVKVHRVVFREARRRGVLCNAVDEPERCDFYYPAVVRRGDLQIAISTGGRSPALAQRLRRELEAQFGPEYKAWLDQLGRSRAALFARSMNPEARRRLLHRHVTPDAFLQFRRESVESVVVKDRNP